MTRSTGALLPCVLLLCAAGTAGCRWASGNGGLDFSGGVCREHGVAYDCSPLRETCGCDVGDACRVDVDATRVCAAEGPQREGEECTSTDQCENGLWCVLDHCTAFCDLRPGGLGCGEGPCVDVLGDDSFPFGACPDDGCDPITGGGCGSGPGCSVVKLVTDDEAFTQCIELGPGTHGDSCEEVGCTAGHVCVINRVSGIRTCEQVCAIGDDGPCREISSGMRCDGRFEEPIRIGGRNLGFCE